MNRLSFLKKLGLGAVGIAIAPKVVAEIKESPVIKKRGFPRVTTAGELDPSAFHHYSAEDILKIRNETGNLIYQMRPYQESLQQSWFNLYEAIEKSKQ